ncbi:MAG: hypothetical protein LBL34_06635 [Clostridiales bacterium]|jgi:hypothetical protein|nr:hypothetical protein [Clostridiales bacterium]
MTLFAHHRLILSAFRVNPAVTDFYSATAADFTLPDYVHGDKIIDIPVAV